MNYLKTSLFAATFSALAVASAAHGQTIFTENFSSYTVDIGFTDQTTNFVTNDPVAGTNPITGAQMGDLNEVVPFGATGFNNTNAGQLLGGASDAGGVYAYPTVSPVTLTESFRFGSTTELVAGYNFGMDFKVDPSNTAATSTYSLTLNVGAAAAITISFSADPMNATQDVATLTSTGTGTTSSGNAIQLTGFYHLNIAVDTAGNGTVTYFGYNADGTPSNTKDIGTFTTNAGALAVDSYSIDQATPGGVPATNTAADDITFDNVSVTAVPEPSTYAMMGLGLLGLVGMMKFRRRVA